MVGRGGPQGGRLPEDILVPDLEAVRAVESRQERLATHQRSVRVSAGGVQLLGVVRLVQKPVV